MSSNTLTKLANEFFNNRCEVTLEKFKPKGFVIHHKRYIEDDVIRKNYPKGIKGTEQYYQDLEPLIEDEPDRFALIKNGIHTKLDHYRNGILNLKMPNRIRFCALALLSEGRH